MLDLGVFAAEEEDNNELPLFFNEEEEAELDAAALLPPPPPPKLPVNIRSSASSTLWPLFFNWSDSSFSEALTPMPVTNSRRVESLVRKEGGALVDAMLSCNYFGLFWCTFVHRRSRQIRRRGYKQGRAWSSHRPTPGLRRVNTRPSNVQTARRGARRGEGSRPWGGEWGAEGGGGK